MLINLKKTEIVLIPPKTGTMSISQFLRDETPLDSAFINLGHGHTHQTINNLNEDDIKLLEKIYITSREPIKRYISAFNHLVQGIFKSKNLRPHGVNVYRDMKTLDINTFTKKLYYTVNNGYENIDIFLNDSKVFDNFCVSMGIPENVIPRYGNTIFKSQYNYIKDVEKKDEVIILKLEEIKDFDLASMFKIFIKDVEPPKKFEGLLYKDSFFINKSRVHNKKNELNDESKEIIKKLYKEDFDFFGY